jgi:cobalt/nickel transport system permease protein
MRPAQRRMMAARYEALAVLHTFVILAGTTSRPLPTTEDKPMHMADALLSPAAGSAMWLAAGGVMAWSARQLRLRPDDRRVPLMGLLGAFVFAAQMVNFGIPGTGSSGHLGGGLLLAMLLGAHAALIVIASVLTVQALFFADGGLLALGANLFNLGVLPCLVAYPLVYRPLAGAAPTARRGVVAALVAAVVGLQLGALGVVLQTVASGISSLPAEGFLALMLPIHLAIGLVEGLATAALWLFLRRTRPELLQAAPVPPPRRVLVPVAVAALLCGGVLSWFASTRPDGLAWSLARTAQAAPAAAATPTHARLAELQQQTAWLPGYAPPGAAAGAEAPKPYPDIDGTTSLAGVAGGLATLALVSAVALGLRRRRARA